MEGFYLTIPYDQFKKEVFEMIKIGQQIDKMHVSNEEDLELLDKQFDDLEQDVIKFLRTSFDTLVNPVFIQYHNSSNNYYHIDSKTKLPVTQLASNLKSKLKEKIYYLGYLTKIIGVCDPVINPNENYSDRDNMTFTERVEFVLDKLFVLYDDSSYPVKEILEWNNIPLSTRHEDRDIIRYLEDQGLVESISNRNARLTTEARIAIENQQRETRKTAKKETKANTEMTNKIFIVHGHDEAMQANVARLIEKFGLDAIILHEQVSEGRTIIEKIEKYGDVGFAVVLLSPDDTCQDAKGQSTKRSRQNVILELGYFIGRLGRSRVAPITRPDVEIPSDYLGVTYIPYDTGHWKFLLGKELKAAGYKVDLNLI